MAQRKKRLAVGQRWLAKASGLPPDTWTFQLIACLQYGMRRVEGTRKREPNRFWVGVKLGVYPVEKNGFLQMWLFDDYGDAINDDECGFYLTRKSTAGSRYEMQPDGTLRWRTWQ